MPIDTLALAVHHVDYRGEKDWWQICLDYTLFLFQFSTSLKRKTMAERKRAAGDGNPCILAYFSKKARPLPDAGE